ncbi:tRNA pseudouridine55 synthase [Halalkaliarchaeum desulfuricum]|uniref:Probable tRNA pseudouridine synthase B n=1 Tax=Halalkaliarchaeum desulfuricum TaxID=2055893 RepID=A0A343TMZ1_9EURY|nr:RNA-guided pseudouridylation complex pseudouridine synthase subunit Cbf5 [Halalkaliarchaeum desulfuricum]AUX10463.1 tRNA pseudouridine55 synthase [Halalkaliarchaeum desulfuricum]
MTDPTETSGALRPPPDQRSLPELLQFGVVNLDKPPGPSAHQVAAWVRDLADDAVRELSEGTSGETDGVSEAAHAGTLDPKVTGCLPVLTGAATRLAQAFLEGEKEYVTVLELHRPAPADLESVLDSFEAPLYQKPPRKSAVSRRLRIREIYELEALETQERRVLLRIRCESGTYVRKLCHDLGLALGTGAHMGDLRRTATTPFDDATLVTLHDLVDALEWAMDGHTEQLRTVVQPAERAISHLPAVTIAESAAREVANGAPVYAPGVIAADDDIYAALDADPDDAPLVACFTPEGTAVCLGRPVGDPDADQGTVVDLDRVLV